MAIDRWRSRSKMDDPDNKWQNLGVKVSRNATQHSTAWDRSIYPRQRHAWMMHESCWIPCARLLGCVSTQYMLCLLQKRTQQKVMSCWRKIHQEHRRSTRNERHYLRQRHMLAGTNQTYVRRHEELLHGAATAVGGGVVAAHVTYVRRAACVV